MRLYPRHGQTAVDHPEHGHFEATDDGGFDLPDDLSDELHRFHLPGRGQAWETAIERQNRLINEELERRKDPATLLAAVEQLVKAAKQTEPAPASTKADEPEQESAPKKPTRARKTTQTGE